MRKIEYVPLDDVSPDPANPKGHRLDTIASSVGRFGYVEPMVRDDRTGYLVSGHGRLETLRAMRASGDEPPDGVKVTKDGTWGVPVAVGWSSRSDTEARAALVALNRTTELGGWEDEALLAVLEDLSNSGDGEPFDGVGYGQEDLDALLLKLGDDTPEEFSDFEEAFAEGTPQGAVSSYTLVFDTPEQLQTFQAYIRGLRKRHNEDGGGDITVAALLMESLRAEGLVK